MEYELSLVEIWDTQIDPQAAFLSSPPVFQTTNTATTYVYGPSDPLLLSGKNYAWRIQAKAKQGAEEIGLFKNQGYSEIFSFSYAGSCDLPIGIGHEVKGSTNANIFWDDFSTEVPEYAIRYRQKGNTNEWFLNKTTTNQSTLWDLKAGTTYEYQLQKKCVVTGSEWSVTKQFTTFLADNEASVYQCGITPNFSLTNKEPLPKLSTGESFVAGDFPIHVLEISGSKGRFTGKGYVTIPYLNSIKVGVEFTNVLINTDKQMSEGTVVTVYDPNLASILDVDEVVETVDTISDLVAEPFEGDNDLDEIRVNFMIPRDSVGNYIKIKDGMVTITNPENGASISEPLGDDKVVVDGEGQVYHIDGSGEIRDGGQIDSGGAVTSNNVEGISTNGQLERLTAKDIQITFKEVLGEYGFDEIPRAANASIKKEYTTILDADGNEYTLAHQAVEKGQTAYVDAIIEQTGSNQYVLDSIVFKTKQGKKIPVEIRGNNTIRLTLKGHYTFENEIIYAVVPSKTDRTKQLTAGAFTLWHMTDRPVDVVLVSVSGGNVNGLATEVAKIFKKGVATINIETQTSSAELDLAVLGDNARLDIGDSGWLTNYNSEQQAVIADLKNKIDYNINKYYVFVFGSVVKPSKPIGGFMPLQRQFGFVFTGNDNQNADEEGKGELAKTIAHEIGHGVFALQHPFDQYGKDTEGKTDWLMDYANGSLLSHTDWKQLHNPELKFYVFQDDEDGEIAGRIWFTPDWKPFSIENSGIIRAKEGSNRVKGTVPGFRLNNGSAYDAKYSTTGSFEGYFAEGNPNPFVLKLIPDIQNNSIVYLFESVPNKCANTYLTNYGYVNSNKNSLNFSSTNSNLLPVDISTNCATDLCDLGQEYFDSYKNLPTVEGSEKDYLKKVAELICKQGSDELIEAQKKQFKAWENSAKSIAQNVQKTFSWEKYYKALNSLDQWVSNDIDNLLQIEQRDELFEMAFGLEIDVLELLSLDRKLEMFKIMFNGELEKLFYPNHHEVIAKLTEAIKDEEATAFLAALESEEYKINEKALIYHFKNRLSDYFTGDAYSDFFREILRLSTVMATDGNLKIETTLVWDIEQKDYVLVSYVQNRNDFSITYNQNTYKVSVKKCISCCSGTRGCGSNREHDTLLDNVSPFHMIGLTILNDVSPLASGCSEDPRASEICGEMTPVPAIFLEYLGENETNQRWKNFGWNAFNVALTIGTLGEGAGAITAIRAAKDGTRVAIAFQNSVKLFDFAYSVADITTGLTESGPYGCDKLESEEDKQKCKEKWEAWKYVSYALAAKGGVDLATDLAKSAAKVSRYSVEELREFIRATKLKKNNNELEQAEIDEIITQLEDIIQRNGLQDDYQTALKEIDDLAENAVKWLDDLEALLGAGSKTKIQGWLDEGLDATKVEQAFTNASDNTTLFNKLDNAKSVHHRKVLTDDYNVPGITQGNYLSNSVDNINYDVIRNVVNKEFKMYKNQASTFIKNASLKVRNSIEIVEDLGNGIYLIKVKPGTKIYRVFDGYKPWDDITRIGNTLPNGSYWTFNKPSQISDVIEGTAVMPEWNGMSKIIEIEVPNEGLYGWYGRAAKQPASSNTTSFYLKGGEEQVIISFDQNQQNISSITKSITSAPWTN
ncbi:fibronectin type III domain-containing protein [Arenibacter palladensis]|uniref:fibronectin type III domain-containing protein n=1 Tax=Arenibacter palladensis TaxID=237373 RepID=UPI0015B53B3B|nr:fibronectin type III domain-containing protein [Arenibacter palladensis]